MSQDKVAIIVLTYNSLSKLGDFFDRVLQSVFAQSYPSLEVIFVDNDSSDGTPDYLERLATGKENCRVLKLRKNYGWSGGNNRGALLAKDAKYLFFMNDDVVLERDCIYKLVNVMLKYPYLGAVQPLIVNRDGSINCGADLGFSGFCRMLQRPQSRPVSEVFYVSGAALLTRSDIFFRAGMFDEDLFLYRDDVDYSWRLRLMGYKCACVVDAKAYHWGSATLGGSPYISYFIMRNNIWVIAKNSSLRWFLLRLFLMLIEALISFFRSVLLKKKDVKRAIIILRGILEGLVNLRIALSKRANVMKSRKVKEKEINKLMNIIIDLDLIFPKRLRRAFGLRW